MRRRRLSETGCRYAAFVEGADRLESVLDPREQGSGALDRGNLDQKTGVSGRET